MYKLILGITAGLLLFCNEAMAVCSSYPYTLTNGTTADATQVMANINCAALTQGATLDSASFTSVTNFAASIVLSRASTSAAVGVSLKTAGSNNWSVGLDPALGVAGDLSFYNFNTSSTTLMLKYSGNVGIGTTSPAQKLDVSGTIRQSGCTTAGTLSVNSSGDIICTSDARLKNLVGEYKDGLNAVLKITPSRFSYKPTPSNPKEEFVHAGFIAQDVKAAIPEAVALQRSGYYSLDTTAILAASVNAIKELKAANDNQAIEVERLKGQVAVLQRKLGVQTAQR